MKIKIRSENLESYTRYVELYRDHVADIKQDFKTRKSTRLQYALELVAKHRDSLSRTLNKPKREVLVSSADKELISKRRWTTLPFMNPWRIIPCQEATLRALEAYRIPLKGMSAMTIIHRKHETSDVNFSQEAVRIRKGERTNLDFGSVMRKFKMGLNGFNYIAMLEFAIFPNEPFVEGDSDFEEGFLIAPHLQGLIWKDGGLTKKDLSGFKKAFSGGRWNAVPFKHDKIWDITGAASYMHKLPLFAYANDYRHESKELTQDSTFLMFSRLKHLSLDDLLISGGEGRNVRTVMLNYLKSSK